MFLISDNCTEPIYLGTYAKVVGDQIVDAAFYIISKATLPVSAVFAKTCSVTDAGACVPTPAKLGEVTECGARADIEKVVEFSIKAVVVLVKHGILDVGTYTELARESYFCGIFTTR